jgi:hypothetical protein
MPKSFHASNGITGQGGPINHPVDGHFSQLKQIRELADRIEFPNFPGWFSVTFSGASVGHSNFPPLVVREDGCADPKFKDPL